MHGPHLAVWQLELIWHDLKLQGQQTQHPAFQHVVNPRGAPNRHQVRGGVKPGAYPRPAAYDPAYRNVNKREATRRGDEQIPYGRKQG